MTSHCNQYCSFSMLQSRKGTQRKPKPLQLCCIKSWWTVLSGLLFFFVVVVVVICVLVVLLGVVLLVCGCLRIVLLLFFALFHLAQVFPFLCKHVSFSFVIGDDNVV